MFEHDLVNTTFFSGKYDTVMGYEDFMRRMYLNTEDFPFSVKTGRVQEGKEIIFTIRSWGCYESSANGWVVFIAYYYPKMKHTVQYSWHVGSGGLPVGTPTKNEWIAG
jgi:hypothetical protein